MADPFFSQAWHRVAMLRPRLRAHAQVHRHRYRGESWYVLEDKSSARTHRFTPAAWLVLSMMDGNRTVDEIWLQAVDRLGDDAPTQDDVIQLIGQLHAVDMVQAEVAPDAAELLERYDRLEKSRRRGAWRNPLAIRIPLWDPDAFLNRTIGWVGPLFGPIGMAIWLLLAVIAVALGAQHWDGLTSNLSERILSADNLVVLWIVFPVVKLLHELGHAWATKARGGEVHEMGIMILVFMPLPYVDGSSASAFRGKWSRAFVGAAGMYVETAIAALALAGWVLVEPGWVRVILFNVIVIAGVSTVVFNLNPLLKYDGYFILGDLIEIPNLAARSMRLWGWLIEHHVFRVPSSEPFRIARGERGWLLAHAPLSWAYRLFVLLSISLFVASQYMVVGVILGLWTVTLSFVWPIAKGLAQVIVGKRLHAHRVQAVGATFAALVVAGVVLFVVPAPQHTNAEGVVWIPEDAQIRAATSAFVTQVVAHSGQAVNRGDIIVRSQDLSLDARLRMLESRVEELEAKLTSERFGDRVEAELTRQLLDAERGALERTLDEVAKLEIVSAAEGMLVIDKADDLPGRYIRRGQIVGYVTRKDYRIVRAVVPQDDIDLVRHQLRSVAVKMAPRLGESIPVRIVREVPAASDALPSRALTQSGGGEQVVDPRDPAGTKAFQRLLHIDLELPLGVAAAPLGSRAYVRFEHTPEPLGWQAWRRVRQLFLSRFDV